MSDHAHLRIAGADEPGPLHVLLRRLDSIGTLSQSERQAVADLPFSTREVRAHEDLVAEGDNPSVVTIIVDGLVCRQKFLENGARQIMAFHVPGDVPDVMSIFVGTMDHHISTFVDGRVATIAHAPMLELFKAHPNVGFVFWKATLIEAGIFRQWIANLGARSAYSRMAHLLCEIMTQMNVAGRAKGRTCELPISQSDIADATGMSTVHANRTLQALRAEGLIQWRAGWLTVLDWRGLQHAGQFDPAYMQMQTFPNLD